MGEISSEGMGSILENLTASNEEMMGMLSQQEAMNESASIVEDNVIQPPAINSSLTSEESLRYKNIGQELFSPILKSLDKFLKKKDKKNDMKIPGMGKGDAMGQGNASPNAGENPMELDISNLDFEKIFNFSDQISQEILSIVLLLGLGAFMFFSSIGDFFANIWEWVKEFFAPIGEFFDFSNGPLSEVFAMIGGAINGLWKLVSGVFKSLANAGAWIWEGIKKIFTAFISGPTGILSFGVKLVKGIVDFASKAFNWLGDLLSNVILGPIKSIFGSAEDKGRETGDSIAKKTEAVTDDALHKQKIIADAATDKAIMSASEAEKSFAECTAKNRAEAVAQAEKMGLKTNDDGTISADDVKEKMAVDMLKRVEKEHGDLNDKERDALINTIKNNIKMNGNKMEIDNKALEAEIKKTAERLDSASLTNSDALQAIVDNENGVRKEMAENAGAQGKALMDIYAKANVADEYNAKSEEEKFLFRMQQAREQGQLAEFRIAEARQMIVLAIETIKNTFNGFKTNLADTFKEAFMQFSKQLKDSIIIRLTPIEIDDDSRNSYNINKITNNGTSYHIMPINKKDFDNTVGHLTQLAQTNVDMVSKQNEVLEDIRIILEAGIANPEIKVAVEKQVREQYDTTGSNTTQRSIATNEKMEASQLGTAIRQNLFSSANSFA